MGTGADIDSIGGTDALRSDCISIGSGGGTERDAGASLSSAAGGGVGGRSEGWKSVGSGVASTGDMGSMDISLLGGNDSGVGA